MQIARGATSKASSSRLSGLAKQRALGREVRDRKSVAEWLTGPIQSFRPSFNEDGSIDFDGVRRFVDCSIEGGSKTILLTAGDSHFICMTNDEIAEITRVVCEHTAGRAMIVAADWDTRTRTAVEFATYAREHGASIIMTKPADWAQSVTPETFAEHCVEVSRHLPVMIVTNSFMGRPLEFGINAIRMAIEGSDQVVSVKDDLLGEFAQQLCMTVAGSGVVAFAGGLKRNHLVMHHAGCGSTYMSTFLAFAPQIAKKYWSAIQAGNLEAAQGVIDEYETPYFNFLSKLPSGWNAGFHGTQAIYGITQKYRPRPYVTISDGELERLKGFLEKLELL